MGLIKSANTPPRIAAFSMRDIEQQAAQLLAAAQAESERIVDQARKDAAQISHEARVQGHAEGHDVGMQQGLEEGRQMGAQQALEESRQQLQALSQSLIDLISQFESSRQDLHAQALQEVVQLAAAIAQRVTKRQGLIDAEVLAENLQSALALAIHSRDLRIAVHPVQKRLLADLLPRLQLKWPSLQHAELIEDNTLHHGGCRLFTSSGSIDADLGQQLDRVIEELLPVAGEGT